MDYTKPRKDKYEGEACQTAAEAARDIPALTARFLKSESVTERQEIAVELGKKSGAIKSTTHWLEMAAANDFYALQREQAAAEGISIIEFLQREKAREAAAASGAKQ